MRLSTCLFFLATIAAATPVRAENLLVITADTLRADRLGAYGYKKNPTPAIDRWAAEGVLFEQAYAEVPLTLPSHCTLFTGQFPFTHGVRDNAGFNLAAERVTLAETLREAGYRTAAFVSSYVLHSRFGLSQGFDLYDDSVGDSGGGGLVSSASLRRGAEETTKAFLDWLQTHQTERFFVWVHFYDAHTPYDGTYDGQVARIDKAVSVIDDALRRMKLLEKTHVLFLSDHGESLGEHAESGHGFFVYDSTLRVPWIFRPATRFTPAVGRVDSRFSLLDVFPTVLQLLGVRASPGLQGRSALRAMAGKAVAEEDLYAESYMANFQFGWSPLRSLRSGRFKFIEAPRPELYDLRDDPSETKNIFSEKQALGLQLKERLKALTARFGAGAKATVAIDRETAERLAALGYVALAPPTGATSSGGEDPKDWIGAFEGFQQVLGMLHDKPNPGLFSAIRDLRGQYPGLRGLHTLEGLALERSGRFSEAEGAYLAALLENPENNLVRTNLGQVYLRLRKFREAETQFLESLKRDPSDYRSRNNLGMIYRLDGRLEEASEAFEQVVREVPDYVPGLVNRAIDLARVGRIEDAERMLERALRLDPQNPTVQFHLDQIKRMEEKSRPQIPRS